MSKYYCLVASLPELSLSDGKLSYTVADFKTEFYPSLSDSDKRLVDLFYLRFDNANLLRLLKDKEASIDSRGIFSAEQLNQYIAAVKGGDEVSDGLFPAYLSDFIRSYFRDTTEGTAKLPEDCLAGMYYAYAMRCKNPFVASWFRYNLHINNVCVALVARKYKWEVTPLVVGETEVCDALRSSNARDFGLSGEVEGLDQVLKICETDDLMERERKMDQLRWNWMEEHTFFNYFTVERLFVFLQKIEMIERWMSLDKEKGNQLFRSMIAALKEEVRIPAEFR